MNLVYFAVVITTVIQLRGGSVFDRFIPTSLARASSIGVVVCGTLIIPSETLNGQP
ncbi:hypothetical protein [Microvirga rosea]|uniref:hypothetical protein n=1 Tax=Microvirga rosea TaxID=2715425 RepID=UPI001D0B8486|nr:hypothetical protein [Microvirga rosea]MCB8823432.1 hypothetical protein [Microvirga rosea]